MLRSVSRAVLIAGLATLLSTCCYAVRLEFEEARGPQDGPFLPSFLHGQPENQQVLYGMSSPFRGRQLLDRIVFSFDQKCSSAVFCVVNANCCGIYDASLLG